jgi:biotin carboxyl carrier protein
VVVDDRKAVFGTVETKNVVGARTRIGGTVGGLGVDEADRVEEGQQIALVGDAKIAVQLAAAEARIQALESQKRLAAATLERTRRLFADGHVARAKLDEAETADQVAGRDLNAAVADRKVIVERQAEGAVLAPAPGRVLAVPVTDGTVVLPGDTIAVIAGHGAILRLQLPERHARFLRQGDEVLVGGRGMAAAAGTAGEALRPGRVSKVYPELQQGRVVADVEVDGLGDYFVGERVRAYVATGRRTTFVVPPQFLVRRYGVAFVRLADGREVVVQPGLPLAGGIEILAGIGEGDTLIHPGRQP